MSNIPSISRVSISNYKSIRGCDVSLEPITFLVGPNGVGKSNFLEALRFLSYGLSTSLQEALASRDGFDCILHKGADPTTGLSILVHFRLDEQTAGKYAVRLNAQSDGRVCVVNEDCSIESPFGREWYNVRNGEVSGSYGVLPAVYSDKLYLVNASGVPAFEPVHRALSSFTVYNPVPDEIRGFKPRTAYGKLDRLGRSLAQMVLKLKTQAPERFASVVDYLEKINPTVRGVDAESVDNNFYLRFQLDYGRGAREEFPSQNISDGTLRALAVLVALFQANDRWLLNVIGLEEPEAGLHPAAAGVLFDSLIEASHNRQIIVTSHSPDLLDRDVIPENSIRAVTMHDGATVIGEIDEAGKTALKERLYTAGELLRMNQLRPEGKPDFTDVR